MQARFLGHSRLLVHRLPTGDRVFGTVGLWVMAGVRGWVIAGMNGMKVLVLEKGLGVKLSSVVGCSV